MTGVGCLVATSLLLHAANNIALPRAITEKRNFFLLVIVDGCPLILFLRHWLARHTILTLNPTAKINKLTAFRTEGTERIVFPLDWFTAGWTLHES
jgi:hypothetical protein